jgi:hypothetical protein
MLYEEGYYERLYAHLSNIDPEFNYTLIKNDITYIKYDKGGFFNKHADYLSFTSNLVEEFTMILCVDANCIGGETTFYVNPFFKYLSKSSILFLR